MSHRLFGSLSIALGFALACTGGSTEAPPPPPAAPPAPEVAPPPPAPVAADGAIGVPECDDYMKKMSACLAQMDPAMKAASETGFKQTTDAWRAAAATPEGKAGLAMGCKAAVDAIPASCGTGGATAAPGTPGTAAPGTPAPGTAPAAGAVEVKTTEPAAAAADPDHKQGSAFAPRAGQGDDDHKDKKKKKKKND